MSETQLTYNSLHVSPDADFIPFTTTPGKENLNLLPIYLNPVTNAVSRSETKSYVWDGTCWNCCGRLKFERLACAGICGEGEGGPNSSNDLNNCLRVSQEVYEKIMDACFETTN